MTGSTASDAAPAASPWPSPPVVAFESSRGETHAAYEHPWLVRLTHWVSAIALVVLIGSGLQIFTAFPSFGPKVPQTNLIDVPEVLRLGGWLAGALMWHFTFMWIFTAAGVSYVAYQAVSGRYRMVLFTRRDIPGVWPMALHYLL